ncbi:MAG: ferrous iron transport protein A [Methanobrevibacter wolinii]|uniref:FeoA family protein n=1 Tax=Methanobrevibacter wolinii TaxID=190977 RepID=UPI0005B2DD9D|nr:FeoA family protein [Methanobrevibacter wolinii]MDD5959445.1 FeoA family protein [Methanobrevibacter wolinii]
MIKSLDQLKTGEEGKLVSYNDGGSSELKRHLMGMGFVKGSKIQLKKIAPLGDPYEYKIKGYSVCLRKEEARNIEVDVE